MSNDELRADAAMVLCGFDEGVFVRDVSRDHENGWGVRMLPYLAALGRLKAHIDHPPPEDDAAAIKRENRALEIGMQRQYDEGHRDGYAEGFRAAQSEAA